MTLLDMTELLGKGQEGWQPWLRGASEDRQLGRAVPLRGASRSCIRGERDKKILTSLLLVCGVHTMTFARADGSREEA